MERVYEVEISWEAVRDKDLSLTVSEISGSESLDLTSNDSSILGYIDDLKDTTTTRGAPANLILVVSAQGMERRLH